MAFERNNEDKKWADIEARKNESMARLNATNNACQIVASLMPLLGSISKESIMERIEWFQKEIYILNIQ